MGIMFRWTRILVVVFLISVPLLLYVTGVFNFVTLERIQHDRDMLVLFVRNHYVYAILLYIGLYTLIVAFSLPAAAVLTIAGGYFFGTLAGTLYTNIGATIGATCAFLCVRFVIGSSIQRVYAQRLISFNRAVERYGSYYLLAIHLIAIVPFFLINVLAGLTHVSVWTFIWTTSLGILPGSLVYSFAGQQLATLQSPRDVFSYKIFIAFMLLALLACIPILVNYIQSRKRYR